MQWENAEFLLIFNGFLAFGSPPKDTSEIDEIPNLLNGCG